MNRLWKAIYQQELMFKSCVDILNIDLYYCTVRLSGKAYYSVPLLLRR